MFKKLILLFIFLISAPIWADDLTSSFKEIYQQGKNLSESEKDELKKFHYVLVPGILSETFIFDDWRSYLDFAILTGDYLEVPTRQLQKLGFSAERISSSSLSVAETRTNIKKTLDEKRDVIFITHSLGGLALLEELVLNEHYQSKVSGIIFLQSPFSGTPIADTYFQYPFHIDKWIKPILPFLNTSEETLEYLSTGKRGEFLRNHQARIANLLSHTPVLTLGGVANKHKSLFTPSVDIMEHGCVTGFFGKCLTPVLYKGPYDLSDGMVPFESSKLLTADFIRLDKADHGELVLNLPYASYNQKKMTNTLLKMLLTKLRKL